MPDEAAKRNLELVKQAFERWNAGDREIDYDSLDPDVELHTPMASTRGVPYRGHEGFRQWVEDIDSQFDEWRLHVEEWKPLRDARLLGLGELHARGRGSGLELDQPLAWIFTFRGETLLRLETYFDPDEGRRAAGIED